MSDKVKILESVADILTLGATVVRVWATKPGLSAQEVTERLLAVREAPRVDLDAVERERS